MKPGKPGRCSDARPFGYGRNDDEHDGFDVGRKMGRSVTSRRFHSDGRTLAVGGESIESNWISADDEPSGRKETKRRTQSLKTLRTS